MKRNAIALIPLLAIALIGCEQENPDPFVNQTMQNLAKDALPGAEISRRECGSCHIFDRNVRKVGPSLKGIFGAKPRTAGIPVDVWDEATLDAWIENPTAVHPKTRMKVPGIKDAEKRKVIIEYLKEI